MCSCNYIVMTNNFILLAEDDEDDQELIRMAFEKADAESMLKVVCNGQEALELLSRHNTLPCLIVLDLNMPLLNGIDTLKELNRLPAYQRIPKVILTTSDAEHNRRISYSYGALDYFVKPSTLADFVNTAKKIIEYCR